LGFKLSRGVLSGPAAQVLLTSIENGSVLNALKTDSLSWAALCHAARLPLTDPAALMFRLYSYNSAPLFKAKRLEDAVQQVRQIVEKDWQGTFRVRTPSPDNPGWYLFGNARKESRAQQVPHKAKVYLSPVVADVGRCLAQVVKILPSVDFEAWKIGRCSYGITRPDKICVYFASIEHAQVAAEVFARELNGIEPQGVPFTTRYDPSGLISIGVDPQPPGAAPRYAIPNSWRLWVSRKMASALAIAKATPNYPLSPEQAALWTVRFLGISPESWTIRDDNFWRN
jgi:hypothetical protein